MQISQNFYKLWNITERGRDLSCLDFQEEVVSIDSVMVDL